MDWMESRWWLGGKKRFRIGAGDVLLMCTRHVTCRETLTGRIIRSTFKRHRSQSDLKKARSNISADFKNSLTQTCSDENWPRSNIGSVLAGWLEAASLRRRDWSICSQSRAWIIAVPL